MSHRNAFRGFLVVCLHVGLTRREDRNVQCKENNNDEGGREDTSTKAIHTEVDGQRAK